MTVYEYARAALALWAETEGFVIFSERARVNGENPPSRYAVVSVISDVDGRHADNRARARKYRLQLDIVAYDYEAGRLPEWHAAAEAALIEARMLPQGNYRMDWDDNTKQAYIQKDYLYTKAR